jgi:broad specificity phosphatase PhoE
MDHSETTFFLVRHGEGEQNVLRILNSLQDGERFGLTESGRTRVSMTAEELKDEDIDTIFSSPIRRTRETAEIIAGVTGREIFFDERLRETDFGVWSGRSADDFWVKYPDPAGRLDGNPEDGLEGFRAMRARLGEFLHEVLESNSGKRIVLISHGDPLEQLHGILTKENIVTTLSGWYPEKGAATKVIVGPDFLDGFDEREADLSAVIPVEPVVIHPGRR